jgi:iron-sulfur cluster assembly protein
MRTMTEIQERPATVPPLSLTESAAAKIKQLLAEEPDLGVLRIAIQGGGCSGFQYGLGFDTRAAEGDLEF